ncbi:MAG: hypothetical protein NVS2B6_12100 [Thermoleophilaceae bacterium]
MLRAHDYRGFTTQRFTPGAQIQPQMIVETSASGRSVSRVGFVVECDAGQRSAVVFVRGLGIARRSGVFARRAAALLSFADGTRLPGELEVRGTFVGRRSVHGTLMFEGHGCSVRHARWAASG